MIPELEVGEIRVTRQSDGSYAVLDNHDLEWDSTKGRFDYEHLTDAVRGQRRYGQETALGHAMDRG